MITSIIFALIFLGAIAGCNSPVMAPVLFNPNHNTMPQNDIEEQIREYCPEGFVYIDLKNDFSFKKVFGSTGNEDLLLLLINCLLPEKHIASVTLSNQERIGHRRDSRKSVNDIHCITDSGQEFIVEMQLGDQDYFNDRMMFYASFSITDQIKIGDISLDKYKLTPIYVIGITDFIINEIKADANVLHTFSIVDTNDRNCLFSGNLNFVTVELPKFRKTYEELENDQDKMLYLFQHLSTMKEIPEKFRGQTFAKLFKVCMFASMDKMSQREYLSYLMAMRDERARMATAIDRGLAMGRTKGFEEGRQEGLEKGLQEGLEKGLQEGLEKGLQEGREEGREEGRQEGREEGRQEKLAMVRAMKGQGIPIETIAICSGLSIDEIMAL